MRVITPYGFGEIDGLRIPKDESAVLVVLDKPFLEQRILSLDSVSETFYFSSWAVVRVLNIASFGHISNIQFYPSWKEAHDELDRISPSNETVFFLELEIGSVEYNRSLGLETETCPVIWMKPWLDRWAIERTELHPNTSQVLQFFEKEKKQLAGSAGISAAVLMDVEEKKILWFYLAVQTPQGIIFERKFV